MTTTDDGKELKELEVFFEAALDSEPDPSDALMAKIMADADAEADSWAEVVQPDRGGFLRSFLDAIGGWPAASGIVTAGMVGVIVGFSPPAMLSEFTDGYLYGTTDAYLVDPYDGFGFALNEG